MKSGLRLRPTFEGIVEYIAYGQETIKYPDRLAKFMRNHPYLTQLDGEGMMEMQEQQENAWKEQVKEQRVKELSKASKSAPEVRSKRDFGATFKSISDEDFDAMLSRATRTTEAHAETIMKRGDQKYNLNNTTRFELDEIENQGDVGHAMGTNTDDRDEPGPTPRGRVIDSVLPAAGSVAKGVWEVAKFGVGAGLAVGRAFGDAARAANFVHDRDVYAGLREPSGSTPPSSMSRSSSAAPSNAPRRAQQSTELPEEAPVRPKVKRGRSSSRKGEPIELARGESRMGDNVRKMAKGIVDTGNTFRASSFRGVSRGRTGRAR